MQENKYNFQVGPLKPCMPQLMKTIDYLIYLNKTEKEPISKDWMTSGEWLLLIS